MENSKRNTKNPLQTLKKCIDEKQEQKSILRAENIEDTYLYANDFINVKKISHGMILTKDGRYLKILEVEPINFVLRSNEDRNDIINMFFSWLKIAPGKMQFVQTTKKVDSSTLIENILHATRDETNKDVIKRREDYINHIRNLSAQEALSEQFLIIYEYEGNPVDKKKSTDINEIRSSMEYTKYLAQNYFSKMDNAIVDHDNENMFLTEVLYQMLNPKSSQQETVKQRISRIYTDNMAVAASIGEPLEDEDIDHVHYIAPRGINFKKHPNYTIVDGMYQTYIFIARKGYKKVVQSTWIRNFTGHGEGVSYTCHIEKNDRASTIAVVSQYVRVSRADMQSVKQTVDDEETSINTINNAKFIRDRMRDNNEDLYDVYMQVTINAKTLKEMYTKKHTIMEQLRSCDYRMVDAYGRCDRAFKSYLPLLDTDDELMKLHKRNMLTSSIASSYMFTAFEMFDPEGFVIGVNTSNSTLAVPNIFDTKRYKNSNGVILGTSGAGKTFLEMLLGNHIRESGIRTFYILPNKGHEYKDCVTALGGTFVNLAPGSPDCINILDIRPYVSPDEELIDTTDMDDAYLPAKIQQVVTFIQLLMSKEPMTNMEEDLLTNSLYELYGRYGVTEDNSTIWEDEENHVTKQSPIIGELYDIIKEEPRLERVTVSLSTFVTGICRNMNGHTNVDLRNKMIAISVSKAGDKYLPAFGYLATECCYDTVKGNTTEHGIIILDEVWMFMKNRYAAEYVLGMYKIIRGYAGSVLSATQDINDFMNAEGNLGEGILNLSSIKFILNLEKKGLEKIEHIIDFTRREKKTIEKFERGQCLLIAGGDKVPIKISGSEWDQELFCTDAKEKVKFRARRKKREAEELARKKLEEASLNMEPDTKENVLLDA